MIKRLSFVSNSSSSSFVIFYRDAKIEEIDDEHVKVIGTELNEGLDFFHGDDRVREFLKNHPVFFNDYYRYRLVYVYKLIDECDTINLKELGVDEVKVEALTVDYCSSAEWEYFKDNYLYKGWDKYES
jgi:hypothetical protein